MLIWVGVAAALVIGLVVTLVLVLGGGSKSDEDQIRDVVAGLETAWNNSDYNGIQNLSCHNVTEDSSNTEAKFKSLRSKGGNMTIKINSVTVNGDKADVEVDVKLATQPKSRSATLNLIKENGGWKDCTK
ncbi:MAG: hypothetical protein QOH60_3410 [Mycobacterium sp.]|jgi:hypothetical protein|nr:hypothetical protein [Mycobacterium sp.]